MSSRIYFDFLMTDPDPWLRGGGGGGEAFVCFCFACPTGLSSVCDFFVFFPKIKGGGGGELP